MMGRSAVNENILIRLSLSFISPVHVLYFTNRQPDIEWIPDIHGRGVMGDILRIDSERSLSRKGKTNHSAPLPPSPIPPVQGG